ncbi:MAG: sugar-binding protein [Anaerolineae bacterium]
MADKPQGEGRDDEPSLIPSFMRHEASGRLPDRQASEEIRVLGRRGMSPVATLLIAAVLVIFFAGLAYSGWRIWSGSVGGPPSAAAIVGEATALPTLPVLVPPKATPTAANAEPTAGLPPVPGREQRGAAPDTGVTTAVGQQVTPMAYTSPTPVPRTGPSETPRPSVTPYPTPQLMRPNGPLIRAGRLGPGGMGTPDALLQRFQSARIDSVPIAYPVFGANDWHGASDSSGQIWVGWDDANLYLLVQITDDVFVQEGSGLLLYQGDSVELQFDADLAGDFTSRVYNADDWQIGFSPGNLNSPNPRWEWWVYRGTPGPGAPAMTAAKTNDGYILGTAIPWSFLQTTPHAGAVYGFAVNITDNDTPGTLQQKAIVSTSPVRQLNDPTSWGTLQLVSD